MEFENLVQDTLNFLFEKYLEGPAETWNISFCSELPLNDLYELGKYLVNKGLVKHPGFMPDGFYCSITMLGISQVSNAIHQAKVEILRASIEENQRSVMQILEIGEGHEQRAHDFATYLKRLGMIECIFGKNDVLAEPTFFGREWYERHREEVLN